MISYELPEGWLRRQLEENGLTQKRLAESLGIDAPTASRLISGRRKLQYDELPKLVELLAGDAPYWDHRQPSTSTGRLEEALRLAGMDPATFAALGGISEKAVASEIFNGGVVLNPAVAEAATHVLGVSPQYLKSDAGMGMRDDKLYRLAKRWGRVDETSGHLMEPPLSTHGTDKQDRLPIYAAPAHLGNGRYAWTRTVAETRAMPLLSSVPAAWGLFVGEGGAPPRFVAGDVLYVHPNRPVRAGDFAVSLGDGSLAMGTVRIDADGPRLLDAEGRPIDVEAGARIEKVIAATFD